jgi:hypothetical protein
MWSGFKTAEALRLKNVTPQIWMIESKMTVPAVPKRMSLVPHGTRIRPWSLRFSCFMSRIGFQNV